jgi:adenosylhomocysteine nucleosidase
MSGRRLDAGSIAHAPRIAILAAQVEEIAPLLARLGARSEGRDAAARYWSSPVDRVAFAVSGMGRRRARAAAAALLDRSHAARLIVTGVAGALTPDLTVGAMIAAEVVLADDAPPRAMDSDGLRAALGAGALAATVLTVDRMVTAAADRTALRDLASSLDAARPAVVDMESYDAVVEAAARNVPVTVLRAVSDRADEELPEFLARSRKPDGDLDRRLAMLLAMIHAGSIPTLIELRRRVRRCSEMLAGVLLDTLAALGEPPA